jgi:hypothetical protein
MPGESLGTRDSAMRLWPSLLNAYVSWASATHAHESPFARDAPVGFGARRRSV